MILYQKSVFRQISPKVKTSSDLLETLQSRHFEAVEDRPVHGHLTIFYSKPENFHNSQFQGAKYEFECFNTNDLIGYI